MILFHRFELDEALESLTLLADLHTITVLLDVVESQWVPDVTLNAWLRRGFQLDGFDNRRRKVVYSGIKGEADARILLTSISESPESNVLGGIPGVRQPGEELLNPLLADRINADA
jgi:hypothetical protein